MHTLILFVLLSAYPDSSAQRQLQPGKDQAHVLTLMGEPDGTALHTCGGRTRDGEWSCLVWNYDDLANGRRFKVFFYHDRWTGEWLVNSWGG